jgi:hypothetical protein
MFLRFERGDILIKAGTVKELLQYDGMMERDVYLVALRIVSMLDKEYGAERDVDNGDGGFVLIAENVQDISDIDQRYAKLGDNRHETVDVVKCESGAYINALFLCNNEFGINVIMPVDIAPAVLVKNLPKKIRSSQFHVGGIFRCGTSLPDSLELWGS